MDTKQLTKFLLKAKINTYASSGEGGEKVLADNSKVFEYKEEKFEYQDKYFGFNPFIGEEIVFSEGQMIWGMNYYGEVTSDIIPIEQIYQFLQESLRKITEEKPFRGPDNFQKGDFQYINKAIGDIKRFSGTETIFYKEQKLYQLDYHGGVVATKNNSF